MKNGILYRYDDGKIVGDLRVHLIRKGGPRILIHTDQGVQIFNITQEEYTEQELLDLLK